MENVEQHLFAHSDHQLISSGPLKMKKDVLKIAPEFFNMSWQTLLVPPLELELDGRKFLFLVYRKDTLKSWYFYVTIIGSKMSAKKYKFVVGISAKNRVSLVLGYPLVSNGYPRTTFRIFNHF